MKAIAAYLTLTAAFNAGAVAMHSHLQRKKRTPVCLTSELVCIPRDMMLGAFLGPFMPVIAISALTGKCPMTPPPSLK